MLDPYGKVFCAREGGRAMREQYGSVVCGIGYSAADDTGRIRCSNAVTRQIERRKRSALAVVIEHARDAVAHDVDGTRDRKTSPSSARHFAHVTTGE